MVQWQSENKSTTQQRTAQYVLSYKPVLNTNTHTAVVQFQQKLHNTFSINAAKVVGYVGYAASEESYHCRSVITSISQNVVSLFQMHVFFRCSHRTITKRCYISLAQSHHSFQLYLHINISCKKTFPLLPSLPLPTCMSLHTNILKNTRSNAQCTQPPFMCLHGCRCLCGRHHCLHGRHHCHSKY